MAAQPSPELQSKEHRALFDIIDKLRSHGIDQHVDLPQIIVCGDQSAGKSSVLEAISGHPFPTKDGPCTRFVTELVLRREPTARFKVTITPGPERSADYAARLRQFSETAGRDARLDSVIKQAKDVMGLSSTKRFSTDVLRVEISGPDQAHLTMVDLPGLFRAGSSEQVADDVRIVNHMVRKAMARPRSIILAVVSASNEFNSQKVTELARKMDPFGKRTLGLITKPDKLDKGSESEKSYIRLANNQDVVLDLGWHVLRNRGDKMNGASAATRDELEQEFFSSGVWRSVDPSHLGVAALRKRLSAVLGRQILRHLPTLRDDVAARICECEEILAKLGDSCETPEQQRRYLLGVSRRFSALISAAVEGKYSDVFFGDADLDEEYWKRIRAVVQNTLRDFSGRMHREGKLQTLVDDDDESGSSSPVHGSPVLRSVYLTRVLRLMERSKGRELQGMFNPSIVRDLFMEQCRPWKRIAAETTTSVTEAATRTTLAILRHVALDRTLGGISATVNEGIEKLKMQLDAKVAELLAPQYPITYNQSLTDMVLNAQAQRRTRALKGMLGSLHLSNPSTSLSTEDIAKVCTEFEQLESDMEKHACGLAADYAEAYYKVSLKRFIDEVSDLAVERQLIQCLPNLFTPEMVCDMTEDQVAALAAEEEETTAERVRRLQLLAGLQISMVDLKRLDSVWAKAQANQPSRLTDHEGEPSSPFGTTVVESLAEGPMSVEEAASPRSASPYGSEDAPTVAPPEPEPYEPCSEAVPETRSPYAEVCLVAEALATPPEPVPEPGPEPELAKPLTMKERKALKKKKKKAAMAEEPAPAAPPPDEAPLEKAPA